MVKLPQDLSSSLPHQCNEHRGQYQNTIGTPITPSVSLLLPSGAPQFKAHHQLVSSLLRSGEVSGGALFPGKVLQLLAADGCRE